MINQILAAFFPIFPFTKQHSCIQQQRKNVGSDDWNIGFGAAIVDPQ